MCLGIKRKAFVPCIYSVKKTHVINLLLVGDGEKWHYWLLDDLKPLHTIVIDVTINFQEKTYWRNIVNIVELVIKMLLQKIVFWSFTFNILLHILLMQTLKVFLYLLHQPHPLLRLRKQPIFVWIRLCCCWTQRTSWQRLCWTLFSKNEEGNIWTKAIRY